MSIIRSNKGVLFNARYGHHGFNDDNLTYDERQKLIEAKSKLHFDTLDKLKGEELNFLPYTSLPSKYNVENIMNQAGKLNKILTNGGDIYGFDLETFGDIGPKATQLEKDLFTITEVGLVHKKVEFINGQQVIKNMQKVNYALGIDYKTFTAAQDLLDKFAVDKGSLTDAELSTLKRASRYRGAFNQRFKKNAEGFYEVIDLADESLKYDDIRKGLSNQFALGSEGFAFGAKTGKPAELMKKIQNTLIKSNDSNSLLYGFNLKEFDIPRMNEAFTITNGSVPVTFNNVFDVMEGMEAGFYGEYDKLLSGVAKTTGYKGRLNEKMGTLEVIGKVFGIGTEGQHIALADIIQTFNLMTGKIPGTSDTLYQSIFQKLDTLRKNNNEIKISNANMKDTILFANNGLNLGIYDYILSKDQNGKDQVKEYMTQGIKRNHYYDIGGLSFINKKDLKIEANSPIELTPGSKGLYRLTLTDSAKNILNPETIVIQRESKEEIYEVLQSVFKFQMRKDVVEDAIEASSYRAGLDKARRAYQGMEGLDGTRGFDYADRLVTAYNDLNDAFMNTKKEKGIKNFKTPLSKDDVYKIIKNRYADEVTVGHGKGQVTIKNPMKYLEGLKSIETMENFYYMYDVLKDENKTLSNLVNWIKEGINTDTMADYLTERESFAGYKDNVIAFKRTLALKNAMANIEEEITNKYLDEIRGYSTPEMQFDLEVAKGVIKRDLKNVGLAPRTQADVHTIAFNFNGQTRKITAASTQNTYSGIMKLANEAARDEKNDTLKRQAKTGAVNDLAKDLIEKNIINKTEWNGIYKQVRDPNRLAAALSKKVNSYFNNIKKVFNDDELINLQETKTNILQEIYKSMPDASYEEIMKAAANNERYRLLSQYEKVNGGPLEIYSDSGRKILDKTFDNTVKKFGIDEKAIAERSIRNAKSAITGFDKFGLITNKAGETVIDPKITTLLTNHGYSTENIKNLVDRVTNKDHGYTSKDLMFGIFEHEETNGEKRLMIAIAEQNDKYTYQIAQAIAENKMPNSAYIATAYLPSIREENGVKAIKYGSIDKIVAQKISVFPSGDLVNDAETGNIDSLYRLKAVNRDTIDLAIDGILKQHKKIKGLLKEGKGALASKRLQKGINDPVSEGMAFVGYEAEYDPNLIIENPVFENGEITDKIELKKGGYRKVFRPTEMDYMAKNLVDISDTVNFLPYLYQVLDDSSDLKQEMGELFKSEYNGKKYTAAQNFDYWARQLKKGIKNGNRLSGDQKTWFTVNALRNHRILETIVSNVGGLYTKDSVKGIKDLLDSNPTQFIKDERVGAMYVIKGNPIMHNFMGEFLNYSRPVQGQTLQSHVIMNNFTKAQTNEMAERQINYGAKFLTQSGFDYLNELQSHNIDAENKITMNVLNMDTGQVLDKIDKIANDDKLIKEIAAETNTSENQVRAMLRSYKIKSSTFENHGLLNPFVYKTFYDTPNILGTKVNDTFEFDSKIAEKIKNNKKITLNYGDAIGYQMVNGKSERVEYRDDIQGYFGSYSKKDRMIYFTKRGDIDEVKLMMPGEKGVLSVASTRPITFNLAQNLWDRLFGKNIGAVTQLAITGHENFGTQFASIMNKIGMIAEQRGEVDEFRKYLDTIPELSKMKLNFVKDARGNHRFIKADNMDPELTAKIMKGEEVDLSKIEGLNYIDAFENLRSYYGNKAGYEIVNDNNLFRFDIGRGRLNESYGAKSDFSSDIKQGKGVAIDDRMIQTAASTITDDINDLWEFKNGKYSRKIEPFIERLRERAKLVGGERRNEVLLNVSNMLDTIKYYAGTETIAEPVDINFEDFDIVKNGMEEDELAETIFKKPLKGETKIPKVYRMKLPDGVKIQNFFDSNKEDDFIILPFLHTVETHGVTYLSGVEKEITNLLNNIAEGDTDIIQHSADRYMKSIFYELTSKEGMLQKHIDSGRVEHSGLLLAQAVIPPEFSGIEINEVNGEKVINKLGEFRFNDVFQGMISKNGDNYAFRDVLYTTIDELETAGFDFEAIGKQLVKENFARDRAFAEYLISQKIISKKDDIYFADNLVTIGQEYMFKRGVYGSDTRYPAFRTESTVAVNIRALRDTSGRVGIIPWYTAKKMNLDTDGDMQAVIYNILNGQLPPIGSESERVLRDIVEHRAYSNAKDSMQQIIEYQDVKNKTGKYLTNISDMKKYVKENENRINLYHNSNYLLMSDVIDTTVFSKASKGAIGFVSNPNFMMRNAADVIFTRNDIGMADLKNIQLFTNITEQKLIDTKHIKNLSKVPAFQYFNAIKILSSGEEGSVENGMMKLFESLKTANLISDDSVNMENVLNKRLSQRSKPLSLEKDFERMLISVMNLFENKEARDIYNGLFNRRNFTNDEIKSAMFNFIKNRDEYTGGLIADTRIKGMNEAEEFARLQKLNINKNNNFYTKESSTYAPGIYTISNSSKGEYTKTPFIELKNTDDGKKIRVYGNTVNDIGVELQEHFGVIGEQNETEIRQNLINQVRSKQTNDYLTGYSGITEGKITARTMSESISLKHGNNNGTLNLEDIVNNMIKQSHITGDDAENLSKRIVNNINNFNVIEAEAATKLFDISDNTRLDMLKKAGQYSDYMSSNGIITKSQGISFIRSVNEQILQKGNKNTDIASDIDDFTSKALTKAGGTMSLNNMEKAIKQQGYNKYHYATGESSAFEAKSKTLMEQINAIEIIDIDKMKRELQEQREGLYSKVSPEIIQSLGENKVNYIMQDMLVNEPLLKATTINSANVALRSTLTEELVNKDLNNASSFLNWNGETLEDLGEAKIGFGNYAGIKFKDINMSTLMGIYNTNAENLNETQKYAMQQTKAQIDKYLHAVDNIDNDADIERFTSNMMKASSSFTAGGILPDIDYIGDINKDIIERASKNSNFLETAIDSTKGFLSKAFSKENRWFTIGGIGLGAIALGMAGNLLSPQYSANQALIAPERKNNGSGSPNANGEFDDIIVTKRNAAPASPKSSIFTENTGLRYKISGKTDGNVSKDNLLVAVKNAIMAPDGVNVNINTKEDKNKINNNWLEQKFSELLS